MSQSKTWDTGLAERVEAGDVTAILQLIESLGGPASIHLAARQLDSAAVVPVADLAANALIKALDLKPSFALKATGYSKSERAEIQELIRSSVPQ